MGLVPKSVRARLTLWYTAVLILPLVGFAVVSYLFIAQALGGRTDAFLSDAITVFANELRVERRLIPEVQEAIRTTVDEVRFRDLDIVVLNEDGAVVASSEMSQVYVHLGGPHIGAEIVEALSANDQVGTNAHTIDVLDARYRVLVQPIEMGEQRFTLAGVYPLVEVEETLRSIRHLFFVAIPLLVVFAGTGGWLMARKSLAPISAMVSRAAEISASTLHERLPVVAEDELGRLASVLNDLLDRLEQSFLQQRRFMADTSHELRSPTAILRSEADVTLSREHRTEAEYRESLEVIQNAARRLTRVVDDLFLLARSDSGHLVMHSVPTYLDEVLRDTIRAVHHLAEKKGVAIEQSELVEAPFHGDPDLLGRLFLNLLDNAIKHSPPASTVRIAMAATDDFVEVRIVDNGPGIPSEAQSRVFERFFRVDSARSRTNSALTSGAGLGLAIARRIAEMHGGRLELASSLPGRSEFLVALPAGGVRSTLDRTEVNDPGSPAVKKA
jgi:heavy metal sensor kinase